MYVLYMVFSSHRMVPILEYIERFISIYSIYTRIGTKEPELVPKGRKYE